MIGGKQTFYHCKPRRSLTIRNQLSVNSSREGICHSFEDATTSIIRYEKVLPELTLGTDPIQIRSATDPLAFATAALAARSRGARALAQDLLGTAQMASEKLIERYVRPEQVRGRRRMPYSYHRRVIYL